MSTRTDIALINEANGVTIVVQHPDQWPNSGIFIPTGSQTAVVIKPTFSYTTDDVRRLSPEQRQCLNVRFKCLKIEHYKLKIIFKENESKRSLTLPGLKYLQMNCISECRQQYMIKYCNCSVEAFFPIGKSIFL